MKIQLRYLISVFAIILAFSISLPASAAKVVRVKGKKVLINLQGEPAQKGDLFYLLDQKQKKRGLVKIMKVKGNKAIAVLKGKARRGFTLQFKPRSAKSTKMAKMKKGSGKKFSSSSSGKDEMYWGIIAGFSQNTMDVKLKDDDGEDRDEVSMSGNGFSFKGLLDYKLLDDVWFRGMAGIEQFVASGESICAESTPFDEECTTDIMYFALDLWGRYVFMDGTFKPWIGAGFSLLIPLSATSSALDEDSITNTSVMSAGFGFDYFLSPTFYIPVQVEYGLLPSSDDVTANTIAARLGAGFSF